MPVTPTARALSLWYHNGTVLPLGASQSSRITSTHFTLGIWSHPKVWLFWEINSVIQSNEHLDNTQLVIYQLVYSTLWLVFIPDEAAVSQEFSEEKVFEHLLFLGDSALLNQLWRTSWEIHICLKGEGRQSLVWNRCMLGKFLLRSKRWESCAETGVQPAPPVPWKRQNPSAQPPNTTLLWSHFWVHEFRQRYWMPVQRGPQLRHSNSGTGGYKIPKIFNSKNKRVNP